MKGWCQSERFVRWKHVSSLIWVWFVIILENPNAAVNSSDAVSLLQSKKNAVSLISFSFLVQSKNFRTISYKPILIRFLLFKLYFFLFLLFLWTSSDLILKHVFWHLYLLLLFRKSQLLEDLYRANYNLGNIYFRNGQHSNAVRCLEQAKECARKTKDKFSESECFHCIGKVWTLRILLERNSFCLCKSVSVGF